MDCWTWSSAWLCFQISQSISWQSHWTGAPCWCSAIPRICPLRSAKSKEGHLFALNYPVYVDHYQHKSHNSKMKAYLGQVPVIQCHNRCNFILQKLINQVIVILNSFLVDVLVWKICIHPNQSGGFSSIMASQSPSKMWIVRSLCPRLLFIPVGRILGQEMEKR